MKKQFANADAAPLATGIGLMAFDFIISEDRPEEPRYCEGGRCGSVFVVLRDLGWQSAPIMSAKSSKLLSLGALLAAYGLSQWRLWGIGLMWVLFTSMPMDTT